MNDIAELCLKLTAVGKVGITDSKLIHIFAYLQEEIKLGYLPLVSLYHDIFLLNVLHSRL